MDVNRRCCCCCLCCGRLDAAPRRRTPPPAPSLLSADAGLIAIVVIAAVAGRADAFVIGGCDVGVNAVVIDRLLAVGMRSHDASVGERFVFAISRLSCDVRRPQHITTLV